MANQKKDEWVRDWTVYKVQGNGGGNLGPGLFSLVAGNGSYKVGRTVNMPKHWQGLVFCPHGEKDPAYSKTLSPWNDANDPDWENAASDVRKAARLATARLEGTIAGHDLILLRCDGVVTDGTPLLVMLCVPIKSNVVPPLPPGNLFQDGTGHGGHPP